MRSTLKHPNLEPLPKNQRTDRTLLDLVIKASDIMKDL
jgi:hypothetical protein